jgi:hypothetical protein
MMDGPHWLEGGRRAFPRGILNRDLRLARCAVSRAIASERANQRNANGGESASGYRQSESEIMELDGGNILGAETSKSGAATFRAHDPALGRELDPLFHEATDAEAAKAVEMAAEAFLPYRRKSPDAIAHFL